MTGCLRKKIVDGRLWKRRAGCAEGCAQGTYDKIKDQIVAKQK